MIPHDSGGPLKVVKQQSYIVVGFSILTFFFFLSKPFLASRGCTHVSQLRCISSIGFSSVGKSFFLVPCASCIFMEIRKQARQQEKTEPCKAEGPFCWLQGWKNLVVVKTKLVFYYWPLGLICYSIS